MSVEALTQAAYAIDTVHLGDDWLFTGAGRLDRFDASVHQIRPDFAAHHTDLVPIWRTAVTYKPAPNASVYFTYGTSFDPSAEGLALSATTALLATERSQSFELGSKWQFGKLMASGALFRTTLFNVRERSPIDPTILILAGTARVQAGLPMSSSCAASACMASCQARPPHHCDAPPRRSDPGLPSG